MPSKRKGIFIMKLKLIMGKKGSGKTKMFIELVNTALKEEQGDVVCVERGRRLVYDIPHAVRLVETEELGITNHDVFRGFITGLHAGNYDITHMFFDSFLGILDGKLDEKSDKFFEWCDKFGEAENISFTMMISADPSEATEVMRRYL